MSSQHIDALALPQRLCKMMDSHGLTASDIMAQTGISLELLAQYLTHAAGDHSNPLPHHRQTESRLTRWLTRLDARIARRRLRESHALHPHYIHDDTSPSIATPVIPIKLELTVLPPPLCDGTKQNYRKGRLPVFACGVASYGDCFLWRPSDLLTPRDFLKQTLHDLNFEQQLWIDPLEKSMKKQIDAATGKRDVGVSSLELDQEQASAEDEEMKEEKDGANDNAAASASVSQQAGAPVAALDSKPSSVSPISSHHLKLKINIFHGQQKLSDTLLWPSNSSVADHRIDEFATQYIRETGLPAEFAVKMAWNMREQLEVMRNKEKERDQQQEEEMKDDTPATADVFRTSESSEGLTPLIQPLGRRLFTAYSQVPPPPYIAHFTSAAHRHALYLGKVIDAKNVVLNEMDEDDAPVATSATHDQAAPSSPSATKRKPPTKKKATHAIPAHRYTSTTFSFHSCTEDTLKVGKQSKRIRFKILADDESENEEEEEEEQKQEEQKQEGEQKQEEEKKLNETTVPASATAASSSSPSATSRRQGTKRRRDPSDTSSIGEILPSEDEDEDEDESIADEAPIVWNDAALARMQELKVSNVINRWTPTDLARHMHQDRAYGFSRISHPRLKEECKVKWAELHGNSPTSGRRSTASPSLSGTPTIEEKDEENDEGDDDDNAEESDSSSDSESEANDGTGITEEGDEERSEAPSESRADEAEHEDAMKMDETE